MANTQGKQSKENDQKFEGSKPAAGSSGQGGSFAGGGSSSSGGTTSPGGVGSSGGGKSSTGGTTPTGGSSLGGSSTGGSTSMGNTSATGGNTSTGGGTAAATARSFIDQAKDTAGQAYEAVTEKAATKLDERKSSVSDGLSTVAQSVRQMSDNLGSAKTESGLAESAAKYTQTAATKLNDVATYFETKNVRDMARDLEGFARRNPMVFLGAAFGLGMLAARFLKSSPEHQYGEQTGGKNFGAMGREGDRALGSGIPGKTSSGTTGGMTGGTAGGTGGMAGGTGGMKGGTPGATSAKNTGGASTPNTSSTPKNVDPM